MNDYRKRIVDELFDLKLSSSAAVLVEGAKWCGKTALAVIVVGIVTTADVFAAGEKLPSRFERAAANIEIAHRRLMDEFLSPQGLLLDFVGELPTPEECRDMQPNAMGWWCPIENGVMFTAPYLEAAIRRAQTKKGTPEYARAKREIEKMADGLLLAAGVSDVPGFIARGFATDGRSHHPLGSTCQSSAWFAGLHAYVKWSGAEPDRRERVVAKMKEIAAALERNNWYVPADQAFKGQSRGNFVSEGELQFRAATHYLYTLLVMWDVSGDRHWFEEYVKARDSKIVPANGKENPFSRLTRLEVCEQGWAADGSWAARADTYQMWIYVGAQESLAGMARLEPDPVIKARYRHGLKANADRVLKTLAKAGKYDNKKEIPFKYANWRTGYKWEPQPDQKTAEKVAFSGDKKILGDRKHYEREFMTEPCAAIAVCGYAGDYRDQVAKAIEHFNFNETNLCEFFFAVCGWYAYGKNVGLTIDADVPAGNVQALSIEGDTVKLRQEQRGTVNDLWFYWAFRVKGAAGRTLTFEFPHKEPAGGPVGVRGPAVTKDGGKTWSYPCDGKSTKNSFTYTFDSDEEVRFYETWQYLPPDWKAFLAQHESERGKKFVSEVLCKSRKGRTVPKARFGCINAAPKYRVFMSSRHHCSEATATPVLEGVAAAFLADDDLGRWLCENVELMLVPFTDYDGVVDGDQGKNRAPHDHNRDYTEFIYPETAAIRDWIKSHAGGKLDMFIDVHCPWIRDGCPRKWASNEFLYTPWKDPKLVPDAASEKRYSELLEKLQCGSMRYRAADDLAFGRLWNTGGNYRQGRSAVIWACQEVNGLKIARSYEVPFANANGAVVTPDTCRELGRDTAKVWRELLCQSTETVLSDELRKVPLIYCSDIFHPAMDVDDHFDLAALFALKDFDVKAVVLDGHIDRKGQDQFNGGGRIPLAQKSAISGHNVPSAVGLNIKLKDPLDKFWMTSRAAENAGVSNRKRRTGMTVRR